VEEIRGDLQSDHAPWFEPEVKNESSSAKDDASERLRCGTMTAGAVRSILLPFYPA